MHIQTLVKFYRCVLKILSGKQKYDRRIDRTTDGRNGGQPKSSIAQLFQNEAIKRDTTSNS